MDNQKAEQLAREFLSQNIKLKVSSKVLSWISVYPEESENVILVNFSLFPEFRGFGSDQYVTVSKIDGAVRYFGHQGE